jgi:hypothetical protein
MYLHELSFNCNNVMAFAGGAGGFLGRPLFVFFCGFTFGGFILIGFGSKLTFDVDFLLSTRPFILRRYMCPITADRDKLTTFAISKPDLFCFHILTIVRIICSLLFISFDL